MLRSFLILAWRNFLKKKTFSAINIIGLALGVFACLTIYLYVQHEQSYDNFHVQGKDIYRVNMATKWGNNEGERPTTPPPVAGVLMRDVPEVLAATRIYPVAKEIVFYEGNSFEEERVLATDTNFCKLFSFRMLQGNSKTALGQPNSVVLTPKGATKIFGDTKEALGKVILLGKERKPYKVTGIIEDAPANSHIQYSMLTSISSYDNVKYFHWSWIWTQLVTYVQLKPGTDPESLKPVFARLVDTYAPAAFKRLGFPYDSFKQSNNYWKIYLQPLHRIWLHSTTGNVLGGVGSSMYVYVFGFTGVFVLLLACINFINLTTAGALGRASEIGVRKAIGVSRIQLIYQFLSESLLLCVLAVILGLTFTQIYLSQANHLGLEAIPLSGGFTLHLLSAAIGIIIIVGLLAGCYPAFYLSGFNIIKALKGKIPVGSRAKMFRNTLVVFQFCISVGMILLTLVVYRQSVYLQEKDTGFSKEKLIVLANAEQLKESAAYFKTQVAQLPGVAGISLSASTFPNFYYFEDTYQPIGSPTEELVLKSLVADHDFIATMGLQVLKGRDFYKSTTADKEAVIISEMAARQMGWADPIGKELHYPGYSGGARTFKVIGVVSNFHDLPLTFNMSPFILFMPQSGHSTNEESYFVVRLQGELKKNVEAIEQIWDSAANGWPMQYTFVDEAFSASYRSYASVQSLLLLFSLLAIIISCMGLLGLAIFAVNNRIKEIGVRKVLGASVLQIILLINREFVKLMALSFLIGVPLSYSLAHYWLQDFSYHITIGPADGLLPCVLVLLLAFLTISYISIKAARANPVNSLRDE